ncbi:MBL fold metallo-hydrolase [Halomarina ordinaria]|uniref:MBL fold metallo-hydrolase n=1 Tax=Halomarina ordinaria TaxID=3033939 RepID=A0ABD5UGN2_9EURY|nr:MBL fold metallo-hydrolase [Halomarina sp. PSRA2]
MGVGLTDEVVWMNECYPHGDRHEHVSVYLVRGDDGNVLVDSGSFYHREGLRGQIEAATDGAGVDAIVLSHSDYPHSGNVSAFREAWESVELVASSGSPELQGLSDARRCRIGESLRVQGRTFSFVDPPLADRSHTTWVYDHASGVLFTADGFGSYHPAGECDRTSAEFEEGIPEARIYEFHRDNLVWLRYVDPAKLERALRAILDDYDVSVVAPIHGHPIRRADLDGYVRRLVDAAGRIADGYTVGDAV